MKKIIALIMCLVIAAVLAGCSTTTTTSYANGSKTDTKSTMDIANKLQSNQPTPTDIDYSLERYNLIRRTYWVNGNREKANALPCEIEKPLGYIVLFSGNAVVGKFTVDGKVTSLNSFLTPDSEHYEQISSNSTNGLNISDNDWLADVDGSYGENDSGIFFFTTDGKYVEWSGDYLYSDIPFEINNPVIEISEEK